MKDSAQVCNDTKFKGRAHADIVKEFTLDELLAEGRRGEDIMEMKATNADSIAVLAAFVLAFVLASVHDEVEDFDESNRWKQFAWLCLLASAASGLSAVLLMIFTSAKLRRLVGRSRFNFGQDASAEQLAPWFGGADTLEAELGQCIKCRHTVGLRSDDEDWKALKCVSFYARDWYNRHDGGGRRHFYVGLWLLVFELTLYMGFESAWIISARTFGFSVVSVILLLLPCLLTLVWLWRSGTMCDLA